MVLAPVGPARQELAEPRPWLHGIPLVVLSTVVLEISPGPSGLKIRWQTVLWGASRADTATAACHLFCKSYVRTSRTGGRPAYPLPHRCPPQTPTGPARQTCRTGRSATRLAREKLPPLRKTHLCLCRQAASLAAHPQGRWHDSQPLHPCLPSCRDAGTDRRMPAPAPPGGRADRCQ